MIEDVRRPKNIIYYRQEPPNEELDIYQFISLIFGMISIFMKVKWGIWLSLFFFLTFYVNLKNTQDQKNILMTMSLILMGFFSIYIAPDRRYQETTISN